jgi:hypothetical protein
MALVEMGMHVDEGRKDHGAAHVDGDGLRVRDATLCDRDVGPHQVALLPEQTCRNGHVRQRDAALWDRSEVHQVSRLTALSCHFLSRRWDSTLSAAKMKTPMAATSASAANIRAMFRR